MKKLIFKSAILLTCASAALGTFVGCTPSEEKDDTLKVVCTVFPQYDWVRTITKGDENVSLTVLQTKATDLHNYTPTTSDMRTIYQCDVFIYVGGESDDWAESVLSSSNANKDMVKINLLETLGDKALKEEEVPGAEHDHDHDHEHEGETEHDHEHEGETEGETDHDHEHESETEGETEHDHEHESETEHDHEHESETEGETEHDHEHDHEHGEEYDEHVWLSLKNAQTLCTALGKKFGEIRPESKELYQSNLNNYLAELKALDGEFETAVKNAPNKTILFADRFPFLYFVKDYGLNYYAAFSGCSAETEVTPATLTNLIGAVNEHKLTHIIVLEHSDKVIANKIIAEADGEQTIVELNSIQSVTIEEINAGVSYLALMETNLSALKTALS